MTTFVIEREHELSIDECREISISLADSLIGSYGGNKIVDNKQIHYQHISGSTGLITFDEYNFKVEVTLSLMMSALQSFIKREIITQCDKRLS